MRLELIKPAASLNKTYRKTSLKRDQIELFKANLKRLFDRINDQESEEHLKNIISDFLKDTWYKNLNEINTKGRADLVIHNGKSSSDPVGVIFEVKRPANKAEMISVGKPNEKALHELLNYYLDERYLHNNKEIKHLIITNIDEWYIFDGADFERFFFENQELIKRYKEWKDGLFGLKLNDWFYKEVARPFIDRELDNIKCTWFNLRSFESIIRNDNKSDDNKLIDLYKTLSPEHLLKKPFANDSNTLNKEFYNELLHIIGLEETKEGGKKLIKRAIPETRKEGSLLENTINVLKIRNKLSAVENLKLYGETEDEQLFSVGLELCLTWLNRILFLKLLEGQLVRYNQGKNEYAFLNCNKINDFDELNELFFEVLAIPSGQRSGSVAEKFGTLPYLNSSLFEETELEQKTIVITELKGRLEIPIHSSTVLKESSGKRISGKRNTLQYLFEFLDAFDFASDNTAEIQEQNKTLINASVLGLIFEKINGYKDGSFFTPGFITMYMCRETIRRAVIQKFNEKYIWECVDTTDLYNKIDNINLQEANETINSLKICDPAVGSGHFLVSALNEIISIKSDLAILIDREGKKLRGYNVTIENDELILTQEDEIFSYNYKDKESQRIQETLFHEKQTIIENCLFGVDINPKSVMICRLRLWIELLKNSYYTPGSKYKELETLPNIDINIKCGNSLISRFDIHDNYAKLPAGTGQKLRLATLRYKDQVILYKITTDKSVRKLIEKNISEIKRTFSQIAITTDGDYIKWKAKEGECIRKQSEIPFGHEENRKKWFKTIQQLTDESLILEKKHEQKLKTLYSNSFEWRFEFPEVLSDSGDFIGFDVVIGNPPYISISKEPSLKEINKQYNTYSQTGDVYILFYERGYQILKPNGIQALITSNQWLKASYGNILRNFILLNTKPIKLLDFAGVRIFEEATVDTNILIFIKSSEIGCSFEAVSFENAFYPEMGVENYVSSKQIQIKFSMNENWNIVTDETFAIKNKIRSIGTILSKFNIEINRGILTGYNGAFFINKEVKNEMIMAYPESEKIIRPLLRGRDVHKYYIDRNEQFIIDTYNGELIEEIDSVTGRKSKSRINRVDVPKNYPAIYQHLLKFESNLKERLDQGEHWSNHRNCAYQHLLFQEKIIYPETTVRRSEFYFDKEKFFIDKTCFMITGKNLQYLNGVLCSKLMEFYLETELRTLGKQSIQYSKQYIENLPIPPITIENQRKVEKIEKNIDQIYLLKKTNFTSDITAFETENDQIVYELYGLSEEEIKIVERRKVI